MASAASGSHSAFGFFPLAVFLPYSQDSVQVLFLNRLRKPLIIIP